MAFSADMDWLLKDVFDSSREICEEKQNIAPVLCRLLQRHCSDGRDAARSYTAVLELSGTPSPYISRTVLALRYGITRCRDIT